MTIYFPNQPLSILWPLYQSISLSVALKTGTLQSGEVRNCHEYLFSLIDENFQKERFSLSLSTSFQEHGIWWYRKSE